MTAVNFPESNTRYGPPPDLEPSQCHTIPAYNGVVAQGSIEGTPMVVVAWKPTPQEVLKIRAGQPIFLTMMGGGLAPHYLSMSFKEATNPA